MGVLQRFVPFLFTQAHTYKHTPTHTCSTSSHSPTQFWLITQMYVSWSCQLTTCNVNWQSRCHGMRACAFLRPVVQEASSTELCTPFQALMNISVCRHREGERSFFFLLALFCFLFDLLERVTWSQSPPVLLIMRCQCHPLWIKASTSHYYSCLFS